nr:recombinase family protein [Desulfovibrio sp.]
MHIIKQGIRTNGEKSDSTTKILFNAFGMAAELERELISQRTKAALVARKAQRIKLGNPNLAIDNAAEFRRQKTLQK